MGIEALAGHEANRLKAPIQEMDDSEDSCEWEGLYRRPGRASRQKKTSEVYWTSEVWGLSQDLRADPTCPVTTGGWIQRVHAENKVSFLPGPGLQGNINIDQAAVVSVINRRGRIGTALRAKHDLELDVRIVGAGFGAGQKAGFGDKMI